MQHDSMLCDPVQGQVTRPSDMVFMVRGSQGKIRGSGKVREFKSTRLQKLTKKF